jgi:membrane protease YdiL (CAAX protease family)
VGWLWPAPIAPFDPLGESVTCSCSRRSRTVLLSSADYSFGDGLFIWPNGGRRLTDNGFERCEGPEPNRVPPLGLVGSAALFGAGALLLFLTTRIAVPAFVSATGAETVVMWFLAASIVVFGPLLLTAALLLNRERGPGRLDSLGARLWLRPMHGDDWLWAVGGLAVVGVLTGGIGAALGMLQDERNFHPSFMAFEPLGPGRYWILGAWLPFFVLNIVGEEFVWRGVALPRQEVAFGRWAWLVNGILWWLFHAAFPWQVLLTLAPITLILPYVVQRRRSTWAGLVIHAGFGAMGFLVLALGLV